MEKAKEKDKDKKVRGLFPSSTDRRGCWKKQVSSVQRRRRSQYVLPLRSGQEGEEAIASRLGETHPDHCVTYLRLFEDLQQDDRSAGWPADELLLTSKYSYPEACKQSSRTKSCCSMTAPVPHSIPVGFKPFLLHFRTT